MLYLTPHSASTTGESVITGHVRVRQNLVDHAVTGDGGKGGSSLGAQHDQVGLLRACLVEQFLGGIARDDDGLDGDLACSSSGISRSRSFSISLDGAAGQNFAAILRPDHVLQDQARVVLRASSAAKAATT